VVILVTIEACLMVDTDDKPWGRHTRDHWNRENGKKSRRPMTARASSSMSRASRTIRLHSLPTARRVNAGPARLSPYGKVRE
jgi:hypothetical protein